MFRQALGEYQRAMGAAGGSGDTTDLGDFLNLGAIAEVLQASAGGGGSGGCERLIEAEASVRSRQGRRRAARHPAAPRALRRRPGRRTPASAPRLSCGGAGPSSYAPSPGRLPAPGSQRVGDYSTGEERGRRAAAADAEASASGDNPVLYGNWRAYGVGLDAEDAALIGDAVFSEMRRGADR